MCPIIIHTWQSSGILKHIQHIKECVCMCVTFDTLGWAITGELVVSQLESLHKSVSLGLADLNIHVLI